MDNGVFWDVTPRGSCKSRRFGGTNSPILVTLMMEALSSSETSVLTRATRRNNPEDTILHSHCSENLKSYILLQGSDDGITFGNAWFFDFAHRPVF
jgi:hypothetical protein